MRQSRRAWARPSSNSRKNSRTDGLNHGNTARYKKKDQQRKEHANHHQDHEDDLRGEAPEGSGRAGKGDGLRPSLGGAPEADREPHAGAWPSPVYGAGGDQEGPPLSYRL